MFKKIIKGEYEYLKKKKIRVLLITLLYFAIALSIYLIGYITTGTKKNLLTVVAILGCLPACKSAVSMVMYFLSKGCSFSTYELIEENNNTLIPMYDMYFTSYNNNYAIANMIVKNKRIIGLTEDTSLDIDKCQEHLYSMLSQAGLKPSVITITKDLNKYIDMIKNLNLDEEPSDEEDKKDDEIRIALYEICL